VFSGAVDEDFVNDFSRYEIFLQVCKKIGPTKILQIYLKCHFVYFTNIHKILL
jgi:hypothetical protein